ncbi:extracellular solute-binding protein [Stagnihabitans tardus]|uniref:Extracellular solute-binding protein n=1 Tax=Stagnihabitans tardus TaxID=2699202 RepID=A0AAE4Y7F1_9RHOB|nr:extracellular solute-binding protein [Stagnihabitans tardus]NBZ86186.1 extracellular solute-binding protein [Stagnihabitans tardus]
MTKNITLSRRGFMAATAALAAPAIISSKALASSGELNFTGWAGYDKLKAEVFPAFEAATGIKVNFTELPDQDTMFAQAKVALQSGGIDMIEPTIDRVGAWNENGLLGAFDPAKLAMDNYLPGLADGAAGKRSADANGALLYVPSNWGTEALVVNTAGAKLSSPASLGDLFSADNQVVLRPHSALAAMGRYLDAQGKLPFPWLDGYSDMAKMTQLWDIALAEAIKAKGNVVQFWSGENEANAGFTANGATVGLCWDSTGFNLRNDGYSYVAPAEGAFAWHQGFVMMKNAVNIDQAHELAKWVSTADGAAMWATAFSSNPVGKGSAEKLNPDVAAYYSGTFNDEALSKLWWWPDQSAEFIAKRGEYADKYKAA